MQTPAAATTPPSAPDSAVRRNAAQRSTIDDVITLFAPAGGPTRASLTFRTGTADETLPTRGINHLIGHLAAASAGRDDARCPVSVSGTTTTFHVTGNALAVANELGAICHWLSAAAAGTIDDRLLETARTATEADAAAHAPEHAALLRYRYGASGWGAAAFDELGTAQLRREAVIEWVRRCYTRGNAVLALSGTKATTLRLPLPDGSLLPTPPVPEPVHPVPGLVSAPAPVLSIGAVIPIDAAHLDRERAHAGLTCEIMRSRSAYAARKRFPELRVHGSPMAIGDTAVHCALFAEVDAESEAKILDIVLESLEVLRDRGLVGGELKAHVNRRLAAYQRAAAQPAGAHELLHRQAVGALQEHPWSLALERRMLSNADEALIARQLEAAGSSLLVRVADSTPPIRPWAGTPDPAPFQTHGEPMLSVPAYGRRGDAHPQRISIDDTGVTLRMLADPARPPLQRQMAWADVRLAQVWDDGRYLLTPEHGPTLEIRPEHWREPDDVADALDQQVPPTTRVPMGDRDTPAPARPRLTDRVAPIAWLVSAIAAVLLVCAAVAPIWSSTLDVARWVIGAVGLAVLAGALWQYGEVRRTERAFRDPDRR